MLDLAGRLYAVRWQIYLRPPAYSRWHAAGESLRHTLCGKLIRARRPGGVLSQERGDAAQVDCGVCLARIQSARRRAARDAGPAV
jgi:hypothetical protein